MDKNGSMIVLLFLFVIVFSRSNAFNSRKIVANPDRNGSSNANQDSRPSSPPSDDKKPVLSSVGASKSNDSPNISSSNVESTGLNDANTKKSSENPSDLELDQKKNQDGKESEAFTRKSCKGLPVCSDQEKTMSACIVDFVNGSNNLTLVVQNEKDVDLKVKITLGTSMNNYLSNFEMPAHGTKEVNISFSGDKSNKVILNAGNGNCELQVSEAKTIPVDGSSKSKDPKNISNHKDVINPADSPAKPKDVNNTVESPTKPKEGNSPSKDNKGDSPSKPKGVDTPSKPKGVDNPEESKGANDLPKSKDVEDSTKSKSKESDDPSRSKDADDPSQSKNVDDPSKSKEVKDPSKSKSTDVNDPSNSKDTGPPSDPKTSVNTPIAQNNFLDQLTFYSKQVTPIYGAYLAFLIALIIGGSWALCSYRQRRTRNGVAYQELEMGPTEPSNAVDIEIAEGWEHDWDDDDWDDEDKAIRSPGSQTKSISSNGLTSRAMKKDGWDADWDD